MDVYLVLTGGFQLVNPQGAVRHVGQAEMIAWEGVWHEEGRGQRVEAARFAAQTDAMSAVLIVVSSDE